MDDEFELNFHLVNHGMKNRRADMAIQEVFVITVVMALETEDHLVVTVYVENHMVVVHQIVVPGMKTNVEHIQLDTVFIQGKSSSSICDLQQSPFSYYNLQS